MDSRLQSASVFQREALCKRESSKHSSTRTVMTMGRGEPDSNNSHRKVSYQQLGSWGMAIGSLEGTSQINFEKSNCVENESNKKVFLGLPKQQRSLPGVADSVIEMFTARYTNSDNISITLSANREHYPIFPGSSILVFLPIAVLQ